MADVEHTSTREVWYLLECAHYGRSPRGKRSGTRIECQVCPSFDPRHPFHRRIVRPA